MRNSKKQASTLVFLAAHDPNNLLNWSGTLNFLYRALGQAPRGISVHTLDGGWLDTLAKLFNSVLWRLGIKLDCRYSTLYALLGGAYTSARLLFVSPGPILAVAASNYVPYLLTKRDIIYVSDATFQALAKLYPEQQEMPAWLGRQHDKNEALTLRRSKAIIYPSKWASDSAELDYGVKRDKIRCLPFGPNIDDHLIEAYFSPKSLGGGIVNFLFVTADWKRKGGDMALAICRSLLDRGIPLRLTIVGDAPAHAADLEFVEAKGILRKSNPDDLATICQAYRDAHFLLVPSTGEAFGIVSVEAQAFGVLPVSWDVGGISSAIANNQTGILLPANSSAKEFADAIARYINAPEQYEQLSSRCRDQYIRVANWSSWKKLIFELTDLDKNVLA